MDYESSNYSGDPMSYDITSTNDVHLRARATGRDMKWSHSLHQKDGRRRTHDIESPFPSDDTHPGFTYVNWNGDLDLVTSARRMGYQETSDDLSRKVHPLEELPLEFLDDKTYARESLDLRNSWLKRRQSGECSFYFQPRKETGAEVVNLIQVEPLQPVGKSA
jgi:hypothetical protein